MIVFHHICACAWERMCGIAGAPEMICVRWSSLSPVAPAELKGRSAAQRSEPASSDGTQRCKTRSVSNDVERRGAERGAQEQPGEKMGAVFIIYSRVCLFTRGAQLGEPPPPDTVLSCRNRKLPPERPRRRSPSSTFTRNLGEFVFPNGTRASSCCYSSLLMGG